MNINELSNDISKLVSKCLADIIGSCGGNLQLALMINCQINTELLQISATEVSIKSTKENYGINPVRINN